ncbi:thioredoxin family protein [bacterium]|nr:thioredoxin family protein [bacterium]
MKHNILLLLLLIPLISLAQIDFDPELDVPLEVKQSPSQVASGGKGILSTNLALPPNVHITSSDMGFFFLEMEDDSTVKWGTVVFPSSVEFDKEQVFKGNVELRIPFQLNSAISNSGVISVKGIVGYQICTEVEPLFCTPPVERQFSFDVQIGGTSSNSLLSSPPDEINTENEDISIEERAKRALESGSLIALLWIFLGGVALSFTPCVYPVIPITIAFIGGRSKGSKLRGFLLSLVFVLGLAIVYSTLGLIAAATGGVFGLSTQNPWVIGLVTLVFLSMGIGMLGAFEINLPSSLQTKMSSGKRSGFLGALIVGATTGLIAAPCVGPVLVALLGWVSASGSLFLGFIYLFVFACGLGLLFVVIGTFAGAMAALPKAGAWMENVNKIFGVILIAAAFYFGKTLVPENWFVLITGFGLLLLSGFWGGFSSVPKDADVKTRIGKSIALFVLILGIFYTIVGLLKFEDFNISNIKNNNFSGNTQTEKPHEGINWIKDDIDLALDQAEKSGKPVMMDFWAEWCVACKELDHKTFSEPIIFEYVNRNFIALKYDGTITSDEVKSIWAKFKVKGLPTVLFLNSNGEEMDRFEAFRTVEKILPILEEVVKINNIN